METLSAMLMSHVSMAEGRDRNSGGFGEDRRPRAGVLVVPSSQPARYVSFGWEIVAKRDMRR